MAVPAFLSGPGLPQLFLFLIPTLTFHHFYCFLLLAPSAVKYGTWSTGLMTFPSVPFTSFAPPLVLPRSGCLLLQHTGYQALLYVIYFLEVFCLIL